MRLKAAKFSSSYQFITDSQEVKAVLANLYTDGTEYTALMVSIRDGDYNEVWGSESRRPYEVTAQYEKLYPRE
jgi:hypothetical protein